MDPAPPPTVPPFRPEPIEQLRARLPVALARRFDADAIAPAVLAGGSPPDMPHKLPDHVFDFLDGMRLIVSVDLMTPLPIGQPAPAGTAQQVWLHVSACLNLDDPSVRERCVEGTAADDAYRHACDLMPVVAESKARPTAYVGKGGGVFGGDLVHLLFRLT